VAAALRQRGLPEATHVSLDPHVLNRARWTARDVSRRLLPLVVQTVVAAGSALTVVLDETVARRWGRGLSPRGHAREPWASSTPRSRAPRGWRWSVVTVVSTPPGTRRPWAFPGGSVRAPTPAGRRRWGQRQKTVPPRARQRLVVGRRWWPATERTVVGDHTDRVLELGSAGARPDVRFLAPLRLAAAR
jgi:hypothetical protein